MIINAILVHWLIMTCSPVVIEQDIEQEEQKSQVNADLRIRKTQVSHQACGMYGSRQCESVTETKYK